MISFKELSKSENIDLSNYDLSETFHEDMYHE